MRADTGHLGHYDDGRTLARDINLLGDAIEGHIARREVVEGIIDLHIAGRHVAASLPEFVFWTQNRTLRDRHRHESQAQLTPNLITAFGSEDDCLAQAQPEELRVSITSLLIPRARA
jgi:hypothetical protein